MNLENATAKFQKIVETQHARGVFNVGICVPSMGTWQDRFGISLIDMVTYFMRHHIGLKKYKTHGFKILSKNSTLLGMARQELVEKAIFEHDCTHVLFVDSDQTFPFDTLHRLAQRQKLVVGANVVKRVYPSGFCAVKGGLEFVTRPVDRGLAEVDVCGTGVMLIDTRLFPRLAPPYFCQPWDEELRMTFGEDVYFCRKVREAKIPIFVDHDLSKDIGHVGAYEFRPEMVWAQRGYGNGNGPGSGLVDAGKAESGSAPEPRGESAQAAG